MLFCPAARDVTSAVKAMRYPTGGTTVLAVLVMMTALVEPVTLARIVSWTLDAGVVAPAV